jgi:hypothetical protein
LLPAGKPMTVLHAFDIPEDDGLLASWLEAKIAGPHLGELVTELEVLREADQSAPSTKRMDGRDLGPRTKLEDVLENRLRDVCQRGLAVVPSEALRRLFREPGLLIELQNRVLTEGGAYWDQKLQESDELAQGTDAGWARLSETLADKTKVSPFREAVSLRPTRPVRWFVAGVAAAAAVAVIGIMVQDQIQGPAQVAQAGWGWNRANAFPRNVSGEQYLRILADEAEEWRRKQPDTPQALAQRINEFREGCSRLILDEHQPLKPPDRKWLVEHCHLWAKTLDEQLAELEAGKDVAAVRGQVDQLVERLAKILRDQAAKPAGV